MVAAVLPAERSDSAVVPAVRDVPENQVVPQVAAAAVAIADALDIAVAAVGGDDPGGGAADGDDPGADAVDAAAAVVAGPDAVAVAAVVGNSRACDSTASVHGEDFQFRARRYVCRALPPREFRGHHSCHSVLR